MGLFDRFKKDKKEASEATKPAGKNSQNLLEIMRIVSGGDENILKEADACLEDTAAYYEEHADAYDDRGMTGDEPKSELQWIGCVDLLIQNGYACESDWSEEADEFAAQLSALKTAKAFNLAPDSSLLDEGQSVPLWCKTFDEKWQGAGVVIGAFDIDSDSYVLFLCKNKDLDTLKILADKLGHRIDDARKM